MGTRRLFFALWPEAGFISSLRSAGQSWQSAAGRAVADPDLHVTLCFLGAVEESAVPALRERAAAVELPSFELEFAAIEYWSRARVLVASSSASPPAAVALARALHALARALALRVQERPLKLHMTVVRGLAAAAPIAERSRPLLPPLRLSVANFYLAQSQQLEATSAGDLAPARYTRLAAWPLRPRDREGL